MEGKLKVLVNKFIAEYRRMLSDLDAHAEERLTDSDNWDRLTECFCVDLEALKTGFVQDASALAGGV